MASASRSPMKSAVTRAALVCHTPGLHLSKTTPTPHFSFTGSKANTDVFGMIITGVLRAA